MTDQVTTSTDLVLVETLVPAVVFAAGGSEDVLTKLRAVVMAHKPDISSPKGRAAIKSVRRKIASTRVGLDGMGKDLGDRLRAQLNPILEERRKIREGCDALSDEYCAPLDKWGADEVVRIEGHENALSAIAACAVFDDTPSSAAVNAAIEMLNELAADGRDWREFIQRAVEVGSQTRKLLEAELVIATAREADEAEAIKLAAEQEILRVAELARLQAEREAEIARVAAETAKREAEEAAQLEAGRVAEIARLEKLAIETAAHEAAQAGGREKERLRLEAKRAQDEADERARKQEAERLRLIEEAAETERRRQLEIEMAETARLVAERQKEREVAQAIEAERQRAADAQKRLDDEAAARARDVANKKRVNGEIKADLMALRLTDALAVAVITAVVKGKIRNVSITY